MIRLTWRQLRVQAALVYAGLLALALAFMATRTDVLATYHAGVGDFLTNLEASRTDSTLYQVGSVVYAAVQWLAIVAAVGFARRHLNHDSAARRYLTTAIFPVYILHQTVIVVCAHALKPSHLQPGVEALLLVLVTASACFLGYEVIRRVGVLRPLFGLELSAKRPASHNRPWPPSPLAAPQDIN